MRNSTNPFVYFQMKSVILEFLVSKQSEEEMILRTDEQVTESERLKEGKIHVSCWCVRYGGSMIT